MDHAERLVPPLGHEVQSRACIEDDQRIHRGSREDIQTKTSLMQSRLVCGDGRLAKNFLAKYAEYLEKSNIEEYLQSRRSDQKERRKKYLNTVFVQEPDIKNGVGGLRMCKTSFGWPS